MRTAQQLRRQRRTVDQQIADLQAKIVALKDRETKKADPALRDVKAALRAIGKAIEVATAPAAIGALRSAQAALAPLVGEIVPANGRVRRSAAELGDLRDALLVYVRANPGQRGEEIAAAMGFDSGTIRPVMKKLIADGHVRTEGAKRGMRYAAT